MTLKQTIPYRKVSLVFIKMHQLKISDHWIPGTLLEHGVFLNSCYFIQNGYSQRSDCMRSPSTDTESLVEF